MSLELSYSKEKLFLKRPITFTKDNNILYNNN